jgi:hypothetical protein
MQLNFAKCVLTQLSCFGDQDWTGTINWKIQAAWKNENLAYINIYLKKLQLDNGSLFRPSLS